MLAFSNDYYGFIFRATQSVELFCAYAISIIDDEEDVYVNGIQFMRTAEKDLIPKLKKAFPFEEGFTNGEIYAYSEKAIGFFISEDMVKGVIVGKQGYFDDEKNETGPTRWRRF